MNGAVKFCACALPATKPANSASDTAVPAFRLSVNALGPPDCDLLCRIFLLIASIPSEIVFELCSRQHRHDTVFWRKMTCQVWVCCGVCHSFPPAACTELVNDQPVLETVDFVRKTRFVAWSKSRSTVSISTRTQSGWKSRNLKVARAS